MNRNSHALKRADELAGSRAELARMAGVSKQAAYKWKAIPAEHCRAIEEQLDGQITRYELREDVFGPGPEAEAAA